MKVAQGSQTGLEDLGGQSNIDEPSKPRLASSLGLKAEEWPVVKSMTRTMT